jgi:cellulose synthase/poly-beta-1,6-N-acetylglucosamine synthase-like glycosyltransferase
MNGAMKTPNRPYSFQNYSNQAKGAEPLRPILPTEESRSPLISLVIPAYNEAAILPENLGCIYEHVLQNAQKFRWKSVIVNDGSKDETGRIAADFARDKSNVAIVNTAHANILCNAYRQLCPHP